MIIPKQTQIHTYTEIPSENSNVNRKSNLPDQNSY